jgi:hypothetical protein
LASRRREFEHQSGIDVCGRPLSSVVALNRVCLHASTAGEESSRSSQDLRVQRGQAVGAERDQSLSNGRIDAIRNRYRNL